MNPVAPFVLLSLIYATIGVPIRFLSEHLTLFQQMYLWLTAGAFLSLFLFRRFIRWSNLKKITINDFMIIGFRSLAFYVFGTTLWSYGIISAKYGNVAFLNAMPTTAVLGIILLKESLTRRKTVAILLSAFGVWLISAKSFAEFGKFGLGEVSVVISLLFYGFSYVARKWQSARLNDFETTTLMLLIAPLLLLTFSWLRGEGFPVTLFNTSVLSVVIAMGLLNLLMIYLINLGFSKTEVTARGVMLNLETVFGIMVAISLYKEIPNLRELTGGILIVTSSALVSMRNLK